MKHIVKHLLIVCIATLGIASAIAQTVTTNNITIKDIDISQSGNRVYVDMAIDLSNAHIKSNKSLRITPIIADGNQMNLAPQGNATRAQAAAILQRYCENVAKGN